MCVRAFDKGAKKDGARKEKWQRRVRHEAAGSILLNKWSRSLPMACILEPNHISSLLAGKAPDCSFEICIIFLNRITL